MHVTIKHKQSKRKPLDRTSSVNTLSQNREANRLRSLDVWQTPKHAFFSFTAPPCNCDVTILYHNPKIPCGRSVMKRHNYPTIPYGPVWANRDQSGIQTVYSVWRCILYIYAQPSMMASSGGNKVLATVWWFCFKRFRIDWIVPNVLSHGVNKQRMLHDFL